LAGQFRSAGGFVLLSGRKLGPKDFLPLSPLENSIAVALKAPPQLGVGLVAGLHVSRPGASGGTYS
jgi:hypothetical protein